MAKYHVEQQGKIGKYVPYISSDDLAEITAWLDANAEWRMVGTTGEYQTRKYFGKDLVLSEAGLVTSPDGDVTRKGRAVSEISREVMDRKNPDYAPPMTWEQKQARSAAIVAARAKWAPCVDVANDHNCVAGIDSDDIETLTLEWTDGTTNHYSDIESALAALASR